MLLLKLNLPDLLFLFVQGIELERQASKEKLRLLNWILSAPRHFLFLLPFSCPEDPLALVLEWHQQS